MKEVEFNAENCMSCLCPSCSVEAKSECTLDKRPKWANMQKEMNEMEMNSMHEAQGMKVSGGMSMPMGSGEEMQMPESNMEMAPPEDMIGLYCSSKIGQATCSDFDPSKPCICDSCKVAMKNDIDSTYFCTGNA